MSAFHNSESGEVMAANAHRAMKLAALGAAICGAIFTALSAASVIWHAKGEHDHRENLTKLKNSAGHGCA